MIPPYYVFLKKWKQLNSSVLKEDEWYIDLAMKIYPIYAESKLSDNEEDNVHRSILIALYMKDVIMQKGGWNTFKKAYNKLYNRELPFFNVDNEYVADEINIEDIAFINWLMYSDIGSDFFFDPNDNESIKNAKAVYDVLDKLFEEAPICEHETNCKWVMDTTRYLIKASPLPSFITAKHINDEEKNQTVTKSVKQCALYAEMYPLIFLKGKDKITHFFQKVLEWKDNEWEQEWEHTDNLTVFYNTNGMNFSFDVASYFKDEHNPYYNKEIAKSMGYRLLLSQGACTWHLLLYSFENRLTADWELPIPDGKRILHENWDFIARIYLDYYYDAD